jgi:hypothetical protein
MFRFNYYQTDSGTIIGAPWVVTCEPEWREPDHNFRSKWPAPLLIRSR